MLFAPLIPVFSAGRRVQRVARLHRRSGKVPVTFRRNRREVSNPLERSESLSHCLDPFRASNAFWACFSRRGDAVQVNI